MFGSCKLSSYRSTILIKNVQQRVKYLTDTIIMYDTPGCYDVVILDVDSKDRSVGVSSPPASFTTPLFLSNTRALLGDSGKSTL